MQTKIQCSDEVLISLAKGGDKDAFSVLSDRYRKNAYLIARKLVHKSDVEDVIQQATIKAYKGLSSFDGTRASFGTWFGKVVYSAAMDSIRHRKTCGGIKEPLSLDEEMYSIPSGSCEPIDDFVIRQITHEQTAKEILKAMDTLPETFRNVVWLYAVCGLTYNEIADTLHIARGTVKSRLYRAKKQLSIIEHN